MLSPNPLQLVRHPKIHMGYQLIDGVGRIGGKTAGKIKWDVFNARQSVCMCTLAIYQFDLRCD
jgi:hypothetical protein